MITNFDSDSDFDSINDNNNRIFAEFSISSPHTTEIDEENTKSSLKKFFPTTICLSLFFFSVSFFVRYQGFFIFN